MFQESNAGETHKIWPQKVENGNEGLGPLDELAMVDYIRDNYGYTIDIIENKLSYLHGNKQIIEEFCHYVEHGTFVPEQSAYKSHGYTVQKIYEQTDLPILNAFIEIVYLDEYPERAISEIQHFIDCRKRKHIIKQKS